MISIVSNNMYDVDIQYDFDSTPTELHMLNNKLFCTFTTLEDLDSLVNSLTRSYTIMYDKIFVLEVKDNNEYVLTYNIEMANIAHIPENTILVHRKKESNTLYTINALNELIKEENGGKLDKRFVLDWDKFRNSIILTNVSGTKRIQTRVYEVISFNEN